MALEDGGSAQAEQRVGGNLGMNLICVVPGNLPSQVKN